MLARFESFPEPLIGEMFALRGDLGSILGKSFDSNPVAGDGFAPPLDVTESNDEIVVVVEIPGVKKDDVKISVEKGILSIGGERKQAAGDARALVREQRWGKFSRTVRLPWEVNAAGISAELTDGLLRIVLPKAEAARAHDIRVR